MGARPRSHHQQREKDSPGRPEIRQGSREPRQGQHGQGIGRHEGQSRRRQRRLPSPRLLKERTPALSRSRLSKPILPSKLMATPKQSETTTPPDLVNSSVFTSAPISKSPRPISRPTFWKSLASPSNWKSREITTFSTN